MKNNNPITYTPDNEPDNEPYLGSTILLAFDKSIIASMKVNKEIAPYTYKINKSDL